MIAKTPGAPGAKLTCTFPQSLQYLRFSTVSCFHAKLGRKSGNLITEFRSVCCNIFKRYHFVFSRFLYKAIFFLLIFEKNVMQDTRINLCGL